MQDSIIKKEISLVEAMNRTLLERVSIHKLLIIVYVVHKAMPLIVLCKYS